MIYLEITEAEFSTDDAYSVFTVTLHDSDRGKKVIVQTFDMSEGSGYRTKDDYFRKAKDCAFQFADLLSIEVSHEGKILKGDGS